MNGTFRSGAARLLVAVTAGTAAAAFGTGCTPSDSSAAGGRGGALTVAMSKPAGNLDPHKYDAVWTVQSMVFEPLVRYAADGGIRPALAASYDVSKDGTVYTFRLRPGVTFSDGTRWDARAAKFNLDRWTTLEDSKWMGAALSTSSGCGSSTT